jgi:adenylate kinase family enzyme
MNEHRIHIFGASGSGTSSLGSVLAAELSIRFFDADDYYWQDTDPPYTVKHLPEERVRTLSADMEEARSWVLSGSIVSWGDAFIPLFSLAVFVTLPKEVRMRRLAARERVRYGSRIEVGGDRRAATEAFLNWAEQYDSAGPEMRSRSLHEEWIKRLPCPVLRVESVKPPEELAGRIIGHLPS